MPKSLFVRPLHQVLQERMEHCMLHAAGKREECDICKGTNSCKMFVGTGELVGENTTDAVASDQ